MVSHGILLLICIHSMSIVAYLSGVGPCFRHWSYKIKPGMVTGWWEKQLPRRQVVPCQWKICVGHHGSGRGAQSVFGWGVIREGFLSNMSKGHERGGVLWLTGSSAKVQKWRQRDLLSELLVCRMIRKRGLCSILQYSVFKSYSYLMLKIYSDRNCLEYSF